MAPPVVQADLCVDFGDWGSEQQQVWDSVGKQAPAQPEEQRLHGGSPPRPRLVSPPSHDRGHQEAGVEDSDCCEEVDAWHEIEQQRERSDTGGYEMIAPTDAAQAAALRDAFSQINVD